MAGYNLSNYPGGFPSGITIRGVPILQTHPGRVWWVDNSALGNRDVFKNGSNGNKGTFDAPFATINYAITQARAGKGDIIFVKPGHAETLAAAGDISCGVAGVAIIGLGSGASRPTITLGTLSSASIQVAASNVTWSNFLFVSAVAACATVFEVATTVVANDLTITNCEFRDGSSSLTFVTTLKQGGTTANALDGLYYGYNTVIGTKASAVTAATTAVIMTAAHDRQVYQGNWCTHNVLLASTAVLVAFGANAQTHLWIDGNRTSRPNTTSNGEIFSGGGTASTGLISNNYAATLSANGLIGPTGTLLGFINNYCMITGAQDKSALINPAAV